MSANKNIGCYDEVTYYKTMFQEAAFLINGIVEHPLEKKLRDLYGGTFFLTYSPMGIFDFDNQHNDGPFYLILLKNSYVLEKYVNFFFNAHNGVLANEKIKHFGECSILMSQTEKANVYEHCRNAVALAFKDGNPFKRVDRPDLVWFFNGNDLIEVENFMKFSDSIVKDFKNFSEDSLT